jgi:predicted acylesterase/phospholipase RssA
MRPGFAFEGCAGRAAFHAGAAAELIAGGVRPVCATGASSGAIVAAMVADGQAERLPDVWMAASGQPIFRPRRLLRAGWPWAMSTIVGDALEALFGDRRLGDVELPVGIPVTYLTPSGRRRRLLTGDDDVTVVEAVLGSCFIPGPYSRWIRVDGRVAWDGAWDVRTPIDGAFRLGASRVFALVTNPAGDLFHGFPGTAVEPPPACEIIAPDAPLPVGAWDTDPVRVRGALEAGRAAARRRLGA